VRSAKCGVQSAECGVKGKKPNSCAGSGQNPGAATVAHLAGGLVRRALLTATRIRGRGDQTAKVAGRPVGPKRNSPGQRPGLRGGNASPPFPSVQQAGCVLCTHLALPAPAPSV
jgi:hypothetical protein